MATRSRPLPQAALTVRDVAAASHFYQHSLGFAPVHAGAGVTEVEGTGGVRLLLATAATDLSAWDGVKRPQAGAWVYLHRPDLPALAVGLAGGGVPAVGPEVPYPGFRRLLVTDPDGYVLVFWENLPLSDAEVIEIYRAAPPRLTAALDGLDAAGLELPWSPGKWTIRQIVHHLVDADMGTFHVLHLALLDPGRCIGGEVWDADDVMANLRGAVRPVAPAVALFSAERAWVLDVLGHLEDALERSVTYPSGWRTDIRTLLRNVGGHALHHISQIEQARRRHGR